MIEVRGLTKRYGDTVAVDDLTFDVRPGAVTGFLGPNGAGKSTTMRMILGLDRPSAGTALVASRPYPALEEPLRQVGALLESDAVHPSRSGRNHLRVAARTNGIGMGRVEEVLEQVGLSSVAGRRLRTYSLGMRQRLGIAAALLGDPGVLLFDEPVNGLDVDGVRWVRQLLRDLAGEGRTVLVSSHLLSEVEQTADRLLVIGRGRLLADAPTTDLLAASGRTTTRLRAERPDELAARLRSMGADVQLLDGDGLEVSGVSNEDVGRAARDADLVVFELTQVRASLEEAYLQITEESVEHTAPTDRGRA